MTIVMKNNSFLGAAYQNRPSYWLYFLLIAALIAWGAVSAWQLRDTQFIAPAVASFVVWLLLLRAMRATSLRWRNWVGVLQFAASWLVFPLFKAIHLALPRSLDAGLLTTDRWLFGGGSITERVMAWQSVWLSELMSLCYLSFYFIVLVPVIVYSLRRYDPSGRGFLYGLMLMYLIGFIGYLLVPAAGPYSAFPDVFPYPPPGGGITALLVSLVARGGTGMDVFPSLHCGISLYVLGYILMQRHFRLALMLTPLVAGLILATLYLRYHYGVDLIAGALVAFLVLGWLRRCGFSAYKNPIRMK